ncbi:mannose-6-phosphate isomerase [Curtobacterium sp. MCBD17_034]|uniref:class I mannose-6-phosphate isomerase n=1 Tax=unclassified Curtobacterium TaxID=257496 RepID=UPI000DA908B4|nr:MULTISPECIES: class I mannose-6-phosphate isomerase [unclassified Curtobacterium]PZF61168.1 mannose-6-phosphate isomerase [Curtobacterium sp. MCBD17_034]PZM40517.1 mannose-6-phosphate isomerase [Curtobacterium sp. MCBD17_031]
MDDRPTGSRATYDRAPSVAVGPGHHAWTGPEAWGRLAEHAAPGRPIAIDTYPGSDLDGLRAELARALPDAELIDVEVAAAHSPEYIDALLAPNLTDDRVFGVMDHRTLDILYDADRLAAVADRVAASERPVVVYGWGATLVPTTFDTVVLADLARWEIQQRQRAGAPNWRADNGDDDQLRKVKRGFFVEWRMADRHKQALFDRIDYVLDANSTMATAKLITGDTFRAGLAAATTRPFRVVPFFDPGVWGGQWMKTTFDLDDAENYAWCFDCVPEENSLLLDVDGTTVEVPSLDLVLRHPRELLGERTHARFGPEFPIRFDFLDTMEGGNLSLQVHPLTGYIQDKFGMHYTQDESYYLLDAADDAVVYLGLREDAEPAAMEQALRTAETGAAPFEADAFVNAFPAKKHDHFLIPAGTVHCSGANSMVLEISATPYIFTFKMWDWGRVGLDGVPRPIHLDHAMANVQWDRDTTWTRDHLVDQVTEVASGDGWVEERTGLHELEFIEVRRHWFTDVVPHDTRGTVNVLNLVEGAEAVVESPTGAFEPFVVHYAETFIVPAAVGPYTIRPHGRGTGQRLGTVKASVRGTERG